MGWNGLRGAAHPYAPSELLPPSQEALGCMAIGQNSFRMTSQTVCGSAMIDAVIHLATKILQTCAVSGALCREADKPRWPCRFIPVEEAEEVIKSNGANLPTRTSGLFSSRNSGSASMTPSTSNAAAAAAAAAAGTPLERRKSAQVQPGIWTVCLPVWNSLFFLIYLRHWKVLI